MALVAAPVNRFGDGPKFASSGKYTGGGRPSPAELEEILLQDAAWEKDGGIYNPRNHHPKIAWGGPEVSLKPPRSNQLK